MVRGVGKEFLFVASLFTTKEDLDRLSDSLSGLLFSEKAEKEEKA